MSDQPSYKTYTHPAGGWGALGATAKILREQSVIAKGTTTLLAMNKPDGFKCSSCAWPTPDRVKTFEFCENGAKALAVETTRKRVTREFFASTTVREMALQSDYWLEEQGRLTEPMRYDAATDHYVPCSWDVAFADIGAELRALDDPDQAEFYTSGRTSNEAAFLYSVFIREFGTNNFPDCSNMCHEPTSRGLPHSIGIGKGTVVISDFARAEAIFIIGQKPGHQLAAHDDRAGCRTASQRADRGDQPDARAGADQVHRAAECGADGGPSAPPRSPANSAMSASAATWRCSRAS